MRSVRALLFAAAIGAMALGGGTACRKASLSNVSNTSNTASVFVQVSPTTVSPGSAVTIRASCGSSNSQATISSQAFGSTTVQSVDGVISTSVTIPSSTRAATFDVTLLCANGASAHASVTIINNAPATTATSAPATMGPNTGGGFLANGAGGLGSGPVVWIGAGLLSLAAGIGLSIRRRSHPGRRVNQD